MEQIKERYNALSIHERTRFLNECLNEFDFEGYVRCCATCEKLGTEVFGAGYWDYNPVCFLIATVVKNSTVPSARIIWLTFRGARTAAENGLSRFFKADFSFKIIFKPGRNRKRSRDRSSPNPGPRRPQ